MVNAGSAEQRSAVFYSAKSLVCYPAFRYLVIRVCISVTSSCFDYHILNLVWVRQCYKIYAYIPSE